MDFTRLHCHVAVVHEEEKLGVANSHSIAVMQGAAFHRHIVDEGAVETFQVEDYKVIVFSFNLGMTPRHGSVRNAEGGCSFAADDDRQVFNSKDAAFKSSGDGCESRIHASRL
jgi:hypothetical protein